MRCLYRPGVSTPVSFRSCLVQPLLYFFTTASLNLWHKPLPDELPAAAYRITTASGSGPGGQGVNARRNKVELYLSLEALRDYISPNLLYEQFAQLATKGHDKHHLKSTERAKKSQKSLYWHVSCHTHRSAHENKMECIQQVLRRLQATMETVEKNLLQEAKEDEELRRRAKLRLEIQRPQRLRLSEEESLDKKSVFPLSTSKTAPVFVGPSFAFHQSFHRHLSTVKKRRREKSSVNKQRRVIRKGTG